MTISSTTVRNSYSGDGSTTAFNYTFKIFENSDLEVILRTDSTGSETVQTITTHYTMTGAGNANGGTVTFVTAPASGITVVLRRAIPQTQAIDYIANDPFPAESHEEGLDRSMMAIQQLQEEVDRTIKFSKTNDFNSNAEDAGTFTVGQTTRSGKILAFDENGDISVTQEIGTYQGTDTTTTTSNYNVRDLIKSTTAAQLNNVYICTADSVVGDLLTDTDHFELIVDAVSAATSATNAAASATAAANSATAAATSESNAATSESNASTSETNAATSATNAATSETNASTSETNAATSATSASTSATTATTKASEASTSATNAATSETNAATSATTATTKASEASTSATNAATSETNAATSATNAATSATAASTAQTAAEAAQAAAEAAADNFDDTYLGAKASDPTVDNDGDALTAGDLYFNTTSNELKVYNGSSWQVAAVDATGLASNGFAIAMAIAL
jgi:chemotaxis protein histidine kinase CheA